MRIGVDARELEGRPTGVGRVVEGLLEAWPVDDEIFLYCRSELDWNHVEPPCRARILAAGARLPGSVWEQTTLPRALARDDADVLFSPAYGMPAASPCPVVVGMHDCAVEATPWEFSWRERTRRRALARLAARRADYLIVGSAFAAGEVRRWYSVPRRRVVTIPYGVTRRFGDVAPEAAAAAARRYRMEGRTVLFVGAPLERRDLAMVADVVARLARTRDDVSLVAVGPERDAARRLTGDGRVRWLGWVPDPDLPALYAAATVVVYPSSYEGFGLPVLEAMACGAPVVASSAGSLGELFRDRAWLVPAGARDAWAHALAEMLDDRKTRARWARRGSAWARRRRWGPAARLVRSLLADAAGSTGYGADEDDRLPASAATPSTGGSRRHGGSVHP